MTATTEKRSPGQLARDAFEAIFDRRDIDAVRPLWTADSVVRSAALGVEARGPDQLHAFFRELLAAVPDLRMEVENIVEDEHHAVVQWSATATFDGEAFQGIQPPARPIALRGCDVFRFTDDGRLDTNTVYLDGAEFARQVGMLPPRGSAMDRGLLQLHNARVNLVRRLRARRR